MQELRGTVTRITVKKDHAGNTVQTLSLEVFGDISWVNALIDSPLVINLRPE